MVHWTKNLLSATVFFGIILMLLLVFVISGSHVAVTLFIIVSIYTVVWFLLYHHKEITNADWVELQGPFILLRTARTGLFDSLAKYKRFWRIYGSAGTFLVVLMAVLMVLSIFFAFLKNVSTPPSPTGIYAAQNILLLPGVNDFVPSTVAVWVGLILTVLIHEFGHGVMSRVEGIRVKYTGIFLAVIPLGAYVEPDEEAIKVTTGSARKRIYGVGIMNNFVVGLLAFIVLAGMLSFVAPNPSPIVYGTIDGGPAYTVGIQPGFMIDSINGFPMDSTGRLSEVVGSSLGVLSVKGHYKDGVQREYFVTPVDKKIGIYTYPASGPINQVRSPAGPFILLLAPLGTVDGFESFKSLSIFAFDSNTEIFYNVPVPSVFWGIIHILFWIFWINIAVGMTNAIPALPFDGGLIAKEYVTSLFNRVPRLSKYSDHAMTIVTILVLAMLFGAILIPHIFGGS